MADFVAVLKKTIEGLSENTPEVRAKVYAKARATIDAKLAAIQPPPPAAVVQRQREAIDDAINVVEQSYAPPTPEADEFDDFFGSFDNQERPAEAERDEFVPAAAVAAPSLATEPVRAQPDEPDLATDRSDDHPRVEDDTDAQADPEDRFDAPQRDEGVRIPYGDKPRKRRLSGGLIAAVLALVVIGGAGYAAWTNRDALSEALGMAGSSQVAEGTDIPDDQAANQQPGTGEDDPEAQADAGLATAPQTPASPAAAPDATQPATPEPTRKFTQRLQEDGSEVDPGPANGGTSIGEGTSVAELTQPAPVAPGTGQTPDQPTAAPGETPTQPETPPNANVAVGQRAIFYEERTSTAAASADSGSIVWSVVQESPGGDAPPEPAIRAEATIPGKDIQLRMTIRRNGDPTLPASHIMEMIFLTPDGFEGGGIENVVRVAIKDTEQATGNPLLGIPARIADGFFLVALSDSPAEISANLNLLRRGNWIDVPLIYKSGRRALITLEKGIPGERAFEEAMRAWQNASSG